MPRYLPALLFSLWLLGLGGCSGGSSGDPLPTAVLSGKIEYQDRQYSISGFTGAEPYKPIRHATIELLDSSGNVVQTIASDGNGNYEFSETTVGDYTLYIYAEAASDSGYQVAVNSQSGALYVASQPVTLAVDSTLANVRIDRASRMAGVFNIYDVYISAAEFIDVTSNSSHTLPALNVYWSFNDSTGTYTCSGGGISGCDQGGGIYILSDPYWSGDTDEFDDDVLWHEFAHFAEFSLGHYDSPGGAHSLEDTRLDLRLSWSEGHGNYFQAAVKRWLLGNHPERLSTPLSIASSYYIDNLESYAMISLDLAALSSTYRYSSNEGAVANLLWQYQEQLGAASVWDVLAGHMTWNTTADTLESFWDGLLQLPQWTPSKENQWQNILAGREVYFKSDSFESDDAQGEALTRDCSVSAGASYPLTCVDAEEHYLYVGAEQRDSDYIALNLSANVSYRIYSHNLRNGADTLFYLYDGVGNQIASNDDAFDCGTCRPLHNGSNFRSELSYTPTLDETVYLKVVTTDYVYNNVSLYGYIGRYGTYSLSVEATIGP